MTKGRLEAFGDAVIAIIITIMVLELHPPQGTGFDSLLPLAPKFLAYLMSFVFLAIYWNNHHHLFHAVHHVSGAVLWANLHLLFWLSLVPFTTAWLGQAGASSYPVAAYGLVLIAAAVAYFILVRVLIRVHGADSPIARAIGRDVKGKVSIGIYALGLLLSPLLPAVSLILYVLVAGLWLVPDRRFERR